MGSDMARSLKSPPSALLFLPFLVPSLPFADHSRPLLSSQPSQSRSLRPLHPAVQGLELGTHLLLACVTLLLSLSGRLSADAIDLVETTANLITRVLGVERKWVVPLEYNAPTVLPNTGGVICTMIEANHCPGSALFLFEGKRTVNAGDSPYPVSGVGSARVWRYLHCGDFRCVLLIYGG